MTKLRIAVVGAGAMGASHILALRGSGRAELAAVADSDPRSLSERVPPGVPRFRSAELMLDKIEPDGVIVATPTEHHLEPTLSSVERDCHVLVEKPVAATHSAARRIAIASESGRGRVLVGHHRRYHPQAAIARDIVQGGALGQLVLVSGQWGVRKHAEYYSDDMRRRRVAGPVLTNLSHELDMLRHVCGNLESVHAMVSNKVNGWEKEDAAVVSMRFESGALGSFAMSDRTSSPWAWEFATGENPLYPRSSQNCVRFMGTEASLDFPNLVVWRHGASDGNWRTSIEPHRLETPSIDPIASQLDHFCDVVSGISTPRVTARDGAASLSATLAVFESAQTGNAVSL